MFSRPDLITGTESLNTAPLGRRGFLRLLGLATGGVVLAPASEAVAGIFGPSPSEVLRSLNIPREWIEKLGTALTDYANFLSKIPLKRVSVAQVIESHTKQHGKVRNSIPPKNLWRNIRHTLQVTDKLAERLNEPVDEVISAYRNPAYNAMCPGARSNSMHMRNLAVDLKFRTSPRRVAQEARELRAAGAFKGGVGRYSGFTHLDTRGVNADW